jgi:hypothetical protein
VAAVPANRGFGMVFPERGFKASAMIVLIGRVRDCIL